MKSFVTSNGQRAKDGPRKIGRKRQRAQRTKVEPPAALPAMSPIRQPVSAGSGRMEGPASSPFAGLPEIGDEERLTSRSAPPLVKKGASPTTRSAEEQATYERLNWMRRLEQELDDPLLDPTRDAEKLARDRFVALDETELSQIGRSVGHLARHYNALRAEAGRKRAALKELHARLAKAEAQAKGDVYYRSLQSSCETQRARLRQFEDELEQEEVNEVVWTKLAKDTAVRVAQSRADVKRLRLLVQAEEVKVVRKSKAREAADEELAMMNGLLKKMQAKEARVKARRHDVTRMASDIKARQDKLLERESEVLRLERQAALPSPEGVKRVEDERTEGVPSMSPRDPGTAKLLSTTVRCHPPTGRCFPSPCRARAHTLALHTAAEDDQPDRCAQKCGSSRAPAAKREQVVRRTQSAQAGPFAPKGGSSPGMALTAGLGPRSRCRHVQIGRRAGVRTPIRSTSRGSPANTLP